MTVGPTHANVATLFLLVATVVVSATAIGPGWASEVDALLAWKASLVLVNETELSRWTQDVPVCNWTRVYCSPSNRVIQVGGIQGRGISGGLGTLDTAALPALRALILRKTNLHGPIPASISQLRFLRLLDLSNNRLDGYIPPQLGNMRKLLYLRLYGNNLVGDIPRQLCKLPIVQILDLADNQLAGEVPGCWCNLKTLLLVDLSKNLLTGELPGCWWNLRALEFMDLSSNSFSGEIPLANESHNCSLGSLYLAENSFTGAFPPVLKGCSSLTTLDIGNNMFFGGIPPWVGSQLPSLRILSVRSNDFTGQIPPELSQLSKLQLLDMANNSLAGSIPAALGNLPSMRHPKNMSTPLAPVPVVLQKYKDRINVIWKGHDSNFQKTVALLTGIDLSSNVLSRCIPEELTNLQGLRFLNLSKNHLSCGIPGDVGRLSFLESLDLSSNELSGVIPPSISNLSGLSTFNVSSNHLTGMIPTGSQIQALPDPSMYSNNSGLCGSPLDIPCANASLAWDERDGEQEDPLLYFSVIVGAVFGYCLWFGILFTFNTWRCAFLLFVDAIQCKIMK